MGKQSAAGCGLEDPSRQVKKAKEKGQDTESAPVVCAQSWYEERGERKMAVEEGE